VTLKKARHWIPACAGMTKLITRANKFAPTFVFLQTKSNTIQMLTGHNLLFIIIVDNVHSNEFSQGCVVLLPAIIIFIFHSYCFSYCGNFQPIQPTAQTRLFDYNNAAKIECHPLAERKPRFS